MAAPAYQSFAQAVYDGAAGTGSIVCNKPSGVVEGDLMIAAVAQNAAGFSVTPPGDWATVLNRNNATGGSSGVAVFSKIAGSSEGASYTFAGSTGTADDAAAAIIRVTGHHATPIDVSGFDEGGTAETSCIAPSVTTTGADRLLIRVFQVDRNRMAASDAAPSGTTKIVAIATADTTGDAANAQGLMLAYDEAASAGATAARTYTFSVADENIGVTVAIAPAAAASVPLLVNTAIF